MSSLKEHHEVLIELLTEFDRVCRENDVKYMLFAGSALGAIRHEGFIPWDDDLDVAMLRYDYERFMEVANGSLRKQYYLQREFSDHWPMYFSKLRKNNTTCLEKYHPKDNQIHQGIYIDIFPIDNASTNAIVRKLQYISSRIVVAKSLNKRGYETASLAKKIFMVVCRMIPMKPFFNLTKLGLAQESKLVHSFLGGTSTYSKGIYQRCWIRETIEQSFEGIKFPVSAYYDELLQTMYGNYMNIPPEKEREIKKHALLVDTERNYTEYEHYRDQLEFDILTRSIR